MSDTLEADAALGGYVLDDQVGYLLRLASQRHTALFQAVMGEHGLTPTQFSTLVRLAEQGACSQNRLGRLAAMDVATIKGVVERLEERGLVTFAADPEDRRRRLIALSHAGRALIPELARLGHMVSEETLAPLTAAERATLVRLLRKIA